jgi:hypothetical protein
MKTIKISPDVVDEWTPEDEEQWMGWFAVHCTYSDWMLEVIAPVIGREPCEPWMEELFAFLPSWIVRNYLEPQMVGE